MNIPDNLVVSQESKVARWSEELCQWRTDEFTDLKVDLENRIISFKCNSFSPIALMQDHYLNMPYQGWTVQPMGLNSTKLSIIGLFVCLLFAFGIFNCSNQEIFINSRS